MNDVTKLLDGSVDDVKSGLDGLSHDDLLRLKAAEQDGKTRKGALDAIEDALAKADADRAGGFTQNEPAGGTLHPPAIAADLDGSAPANIPPADTVDTAGAPQQVVPDVDMSHPVVDANPRANTTEVQNRIDFNDPNRSGREVVEEALKGRD